MDKHQEGTERVFLQALHGTEEFKQDRAPLRAYRF